MNHVQVDHQVDDGIAGKGLEMQVNVRSKLPSSVKGIKLRNAFSDQLNSHFIELTDVQGNVQRFNAQDLMKGECQECLQVFYVQSKFGDMTCPHCQSKKVKWAWGKLQIGFIPEEEGHLLFEELPKKEKK